MCNQLFNVRLKNIGAAANSWGYSSSGKKGEGKDGFVPYGAPYTTGDVIAMLVDTMTGTVRYSKNGEDQGIAFRGLEAESLHAAVCGGGGVEGDLHEIQALEVPRVFDPSTKKGGLRVVSEGLGLRADSHGVICLGHGGMRVGQHAWHFKVRRCVVGVGRLHLVWCVDPGACWLGGWLAGWHRCSSPAKSPCTSESPTRSYCGSSQPRPRCVVVGTTRPWVARSACRLPRPWAPWRTASCQPTARATKRTTSWPCSLTRTRGRCASRSTTTTRALRSTIWRGEPSCR